MFFFLQSYHPFSRKVLFQCPDELVALRASSESLTERKFVENLPVWYANKGLVVSPEALAEYSRVAIVRMRAITGMTDEGIAALRSHGAEILCFKSVDDIVLENPVEKARVIIDPWVVHEVWHIVEERNGVLNSPIAEGTAEFARLAYVDARRKREQKLDESYRCADLTDADDGRNIAVAQLGKNVYDKGLQIAQKHAVKLTDLLKPEVRVLMEKEMKDFQSAFVRERVEKDDVPYSERGKISRLLYPELNVLDASLTKEDLLRVMSLLGMKKMSEEFGSQDCSKLLECYKLMGYGSKV